MKHLFIVNPVAGHHDRTAEMREKVPPLFGSPEQYEIYTTSAPGDGEAKVRREALSGQELRIYAVGGDGTLNECVNGAYGCPNAAVTLYPGGTGNDFVRMFGPEKQRLYDLGELVNGEVRRLDLIECCGRLGVNICSVGIDARVGTQVHEYSRLPLLGGSAAYICSAVVNFCRGVGQPMSVSFGDESLSGSVALVCACNGRYYGGGWCPVPEARPDDGVLDFLVVRNAGRAKLLTLIPRYASGKYRQIPEKYISHYRGTELRISSPEELCVNVDGERLSACELSFRLIPAAVNFIFPRDMEFFKFNSQKYGDILRKSNISL
ncbi:MAG: diacylglycerol/lipid kinase family protein [Candidatus Heteroscillospira sp.]